MKTSVFECSLFRGRSLIGNICGPGIMNVEGLTMGIRTVIFTSTKSFTTSLHQLLGWSSIKSLSIKSIC